MANVRRTALSTSLRTARVDRGLSQAQLAKKLGLRQRQISDLERAAMDPRLSTIQNVARALDLELTLIPRQLISAVDALRRDDAGSSGTRPMYDLEDDKDADDDVPVEIGAETRRLHVPTQRRQR
jgi:HTH-type transcriptional regulator / antitoxin HipB